MVNIPKSLNVIYYYRGKKKAPNHIIISVAIGKIFKEILFS